MAGLVGYDSSDEDEDIQEVAKAQPSSPAESKNATASQHGSANRIDEPAQASSASSNPAKPPAGESTATGPAPAPGPALGPVMGPALGPSLPPSSSASTTPLATPLPDPSTDPQDPPRSPYSASRALLRDLTLPAVPDMDIPPSPPHRPASLDALNARLETLLEMKRRPPRRGAAAPAHFNERLAGSTALRNPALMDKLLGFVGVDAAATFGGGDGGGDGDGDGAAVAQYETTLPAEVWDPAAFPGWAARGALRRSQEKVQRERERGKGEAVDFVPAVRSRGGTPRAGGGSGAVAPVTGKRKTRFDA